MNTKQKRKLSSEEIIKDMDHLIFIFGDEGATMKPLIVAHLIVMGWDRSKATSYAVLVEGYAKLKKEGITNIWKRG